MSAYARALAAEAHADLVDGADVGDEDIAQAYLVAADAWLEVDEPERAAHNLLVAAEYRRRNLDTRLPQGLVPGGLSRRVNPETGRGSVYAPTLTIGEAVTIAKLAGWLQLGERGSLWRLPATDKVGRENLSRLAWLFRMTVLPRARAFWFYGERTSLAPRLGSATEFSRDFLDAFRQLLARELGAR